MKRRFSNPLPAFNLVDEPWSLEGPLAKNYLSQGLKPDTTVRYVDAPRTGMIQPGDTVYLLQQEPGHYPTFGFELGETRIPSGGGDVVIHHLQLVGRDGSFLQEFAESGILNDNAVVDGREF